MLIKIVTVLVLALAGSLARPENTKYYGGPGPAVGGHGVALEVDSSVINDLGHGVVGTGHGPVTAVAHAVAVGVVPSHGPAHNVGGSYGGSSGSCRYWCRTPQGQVYCCEGDEELVALPSVKPGQCPPVRPQCPPVRYFRPPTTCSSDSKCPGAEKCCFDTCLEHHTCKLPILY